MSYQVIARKWRPQTFEEVTGQEPITRTLRNAVEHERLHHAYLFSGARGVGKTTTARLLAKALNCHRTTKPNPTPCRVTDDLACPSCREIAEGRSIDVQEIDAASNTGVDNVRDAIINTVAVRPARDRYKVFIIDEVHMLSNQAFNALLKTLEEPPAQVVFIMATTEAHKLPDTILSRCQQFEFRTIPAARIAERLRLIADAEGVVVSDEALDEIARAGEGSMRDAQSAFDQVISFSDREIKVEDVEMALGLASFDLLRRVTAAVANHHPSEALRVVDDLVMRGHDLRNFCRDLMGHLRDLLVIKVNGNTTNPNMEQSNQSPDRHSELARVAEHFSESDLVRFFHSLTETEKHLRESAHPRYQLEVGLVKLTEMRRLAPLTQLVERLTKLEQLLGVAGSGRTASPSGSTTGGAPPPTTAAATTTSSAGGGSASSSSSGNAGTKSGVAPSFEAAMLVAGSDASSSKADHTYNSHTVFGEESTPTSGEPLAAAVTLFDKPDNTLTLPASSPLPTSSTTPPALKLVSPAASSRLSIANTSVTTCPPASASSSDKEDEIQSSPSSEDVVIDVASCSEGESITLQRLNQELRERRRPFLAIALEGAQRVTTSTNEVSIEFASDAKHLRDNLAKPESLKILQTICRELTGREMNVRIILTNANDTTRAAMAAAVAAAEPRTKEDDARAEQQALRKMAEEHPVVQQMLRVFRGEIVDVRRVDPKEIS